MGYGPTLARIKALAMALKEFYQAINVERSTDQIKQVCGDISLCAMLWRSLSGNWCMVGFLQAAQKFTQNKEILMELLKTKYPQHVNALNNLQRRIIE